MVFVHFVSVTGCGYVCFAKAAGDLTEREAEERERAAATAGFVGAPNFGERAPVGALGGELGRMSFIEIERVGGEEGVGEEEEGRVLLTRWKEAGMFRFELDLFMFVLDADFVIKLDEDLVKGLLLVPPFAPGVLRPIEDGERVKTGGSRLLPFLARD